MSANLRGTPVPSSRFGAKGPTHSEDPFGLLDGIIRAARKKRDQALDARDWLDRHNSGDVDEKLADAQRALDRAVEGGFFDAYEGRPSVGETMAQVRRAMLDEAATFLDDPSVEVCLVDETYDCPIEDCRKWRTRLVARPREG